MMRAGVEKFLESIPSIIQAFSFFLGESGDAVLDGGCSGRREVFFNKVLSQSIPVSVVARWFTSKPPLSSAFQRERKGSQTKSVFVEVSVLESAAEIKEVCKMSARIV